MAALDGFVRGARELEVKVHGARVVEEEYGYIELGRRFRVALVGEEQAHRVLLALRRTEGRWLVTEILIL